MPKKTIAHRAVLAVFTLTSLGAMLAVAQPALGQDVEVVVNGGQMQFNQPPVERDGRVFVPLRGVFERLGASVVYDNGTINATGNGRNVSLQIGSTQATVNGQPQILDVAPFIVGSTTLVPLRFIAQALGASVDWNNDTSTVTITGTNGSAEARPGREDQRNLSFHLSNETPTDSVNTRNPALHATYSEPVKRGSLRVSVDGRDVTSNVYSSASGFDVTPSFPLGRGTHRVTVTGTTEAGASFSTAWTFRTGGISGTTPREK
jgi:hypothetical protein